MTSFKDNQLVAMNFSEKLNVPMNTTVFKRQLGIANMLLKEYKYEDIILVICYLRLFPTKNKIMSLGFIPYVIDETLPKAIHYFKQTEEKIKPIIKEEKKVEIKNEVIGKRSMFNKNRRF